MWREILLAFLNYWFWRCLVPVSFLLATFYILIFLIEVFFHGYSTATCTAYSRG